VGAPIYRDELWQGASDPAVIENEATGEWWMFYTQRRALLEAPGVEWVHGSRIAVAVSADGGASWNYRGVVDGLDPEGDQALNTHWAPEVVRFGGEYHMYLTWIAGTPDDWAGHERHVVHFVSDDLAAWRRVGRVEVGSDFAIDAAVARTPDGRLRLWFKNEARGSTAASGCPRAWSSTASRTKGPTCSSSAAGGGCSSTSGAGWASTAAATPSTGRGSGSSFSTGPATIRSTGRSAGTPTSSWAATPP
jgi:hypothetical protein